MSICCDSDGDGKLFPPHVPEAIPLLGDDGAALYARLRARMTQAVCAEHGAFEPANSLISWISVDGEAQQAAATAAEQPEAPRSFDWRRDPCEGTYAPHVDKANQPEYDLSALLYLTTQGVHFSGGEFAFNDVACDRLVRPIAGRLLSFPSGFDNLHQVRPVRSGNRLVLSVWFKRV